MSGLRLVVYVRVSREDERPENQEYAIFKWAAERGHQIVDVVRDVDVSGVHRPPRDRAGRKWRNCLSLPTASSCTP
jgi:DNA invertase Pin-like site-specific DNA recombinase